MFIKRISESIVYRGYRSLDTHEWFGAIDKYASHMRSLNYKLIGTGKLIKYNEFNTEESLRIKNIGVKSMDNKANNVLSIEVSFWPVNIRLIKLQDEAYYVSLGKKDTNGYEYYKCSSMDGLINFLNKMKYTVNESAEYNSKYLTSEEFVRFIEDYEPIKMNKNQLTKLIKTIGYPIEPNILKDKKMLVQHFIGFLHNVKNKNMEIYVYNVNLDLIDISIISFYDDWFIVVYDIYDAMGDDLNLLNYYKCDRFEELIKKIKSLKKLNSKLNANH